jgi:hypothetical protein
MERLVADGVLERDGSFRFRTAAENLEVLPGDFVQAISTGPGAARFLGQVEEAAIEFILDVETTRTTRALPRLGAHEPDTWSTETHEVVPKGLRAGSGRVLAEFDETKSGWSVVPQPELHGRTGRIALGQAPDEVVELFVSKATGQGPTLRVGALLGVSRPVEVRLLADGFKRPTGVFGQ